MNLVITNLIIMLAKLSLKVIKGANVHLFNINFGVNANVVAVNVAVMLLTVAVMLLTVAVTSLTVTVMSLTDAVAVGSL